MELYLGDLILIKSCKRLIEAATLVPLPSMARCFCWKLRFNIGPDLDQNFCWFEFLINFSLSLLTFVSFLFGILEDSFILFIHLFFSVRLRLPISSLIFHFALLLFLIIFLDGIEGWYLIFYSLAIIFFRVFFTSSIDKTSSFNSYQLSFLFSIEIHYEILMDHRFWFLFGRKFYRLAWQF